MSMPPNMFEHTGDFQDEKLVEGEEDAAEEHQHGIDCGHEAVEHDDHVDYVDGEKRHWWSKDHWAQH